MKYDLSDIMKKAHNFYKTGKYTWSESLKKSWKMAKFSVRVKEEIANMVDYKSADDKAFTNRLRKENEASMIISMLRLPSIILLTTEGVLALVSWVINTIST